MFKRKKKENKEKHTSDGASSSYNETTQIQKTNNGGRASTIITRQISSQSNQFSSTQERTVTVHHSSSTGAVPQLLSGSPLTSLQADAVPWKFGTGSPRNSSLLSSSSGLPATNLSSTFATSSNSAQPRLSLPYSPSRSPVAPSTAAPYRSAFSPNTFGSYPSRSRPPPLSTISAQSAAQNQNIAQSLPAREEDIIPTYPNNCSKRGKALIINNIKFIDKKDERVGAEKDSQDLTKLLKTMGFEVDHNKNLKGKEMLTKVDKFSKSSFHSHDMSVVVIMSHGNNIVQDEKKSVRIKGGYTEIAGIDNVPLLVDDIIEKFTIANCHTSLKGKPKIFIFQCCRGEKDQEICHDAAPIRKVLKEHSDILIAFSTLPGFLSNRDPKTGSWYIQSICEVFERHHKTYHIEEMLKIVDDKLSKKHPQFTQTSTYENRGFKRCYLHPKVTK